MTIEKVNIKISAKDDASSKIKKVGGSLGGLKTALKGVAIGFAAIKIKQFITESIELYKVQEKAEARLKASINNLKDLGSGYEKTDENIKIVTEDLKKYAAGLQKVTTFGDEAIISASALLGSFQLGGDEIKLLTPALLDMAAATEKTTGAQADLNDLANAMGKAMATGAGALSRYGVVLTDTQAELFNTAEGMEKTALLAQILADNFGGAAEELASTTAGQLEQAANQWGDFKEKVGAILAPLLLKVATGLLWMVTEFQKGVKIIMDAWDAMWVWVFTTYYSWKESIINSWNGFWTALGDWAKVVIDLIRGWIDSIIEAFNRLIAKAHEAVDALPGASIAQSIGKFFDLGQYLAEGGIVKPLYAANGAFVPRGTDTVPAMLTPGEVVLNAGQQKGLMGKMGGVTINITGTFLSEGVAEEVGDMIVRKLQLSTKVV